MNTSSFSRLLLLLCCGFTLLLSSDISASAQGLAEPWPGAHSSEEFAGGEIRDVFCDLVGLLEGELGALVFMAAGVAAILGAAFGNLRQSTSAVAVGVGLFTISAGVGVFFGDFDCGARAGGGGQTQRTRLESEQQPGSQASSGLELPFLGLKTTAQDVESEEAEAETKEQFDDKVTDIADTF